MARGMNHFKKWNLTQRCKSCCLLLLTNANLAWKRKLYIFDFLFTKLVSYGLLQTDGPCLSNSNSCAGMPYFCLFLSVSVEAISWLKAILHQLELTPETWWSQEGIEIQSSATLPLLKDSFLRFRFIFHTFESNLLPYLDLNWKNCLMLNFSLLAPE